MEAEEYKELIRSKGVLGYTTLNITLKELIAKKDIRLTTEITRILHINKIEKPALHINPNDNTTNYYKIDLSKEDIDAIADIFFDLEASFVGKDGSTTPTAAFYADLADRWFNLIKENTE